jgi:hypothetical protein
MVSREEKESDGTGEKDESEGRGWLSELRIHGE